jgi:hypothetical protein
VALSAMFCAKFQPVIWTESDTWPLVRLSSIDGVSIR